MQLVNFLHKFFATRLDKCFSIGMKKVQHHFSTLLNSFLLQTYYFNKQKSFLLRSLKDWILTEEEKVMKRRKHRSRDFEKKDADSSSMTCPSPENRTSAAVKGSSSSSGGGQNASQNIIILPILPLSLSGKNDASDVLSSLNKQEILSYINDKLNINLGRHATLHHLTCTSIVRLINFSFLPQNPFSSWPLLLLH